MLKWLFKRKDKAKKQTEKQTSKGNNKYESLLDGGSITEILDAFDDN